MKKKARQLAEQKSGKKQIDPGDLWKLFHRLAQHLTTTADQRPTSLDLFLLRNVLLCCLHMLDQATKRGDNEALWDIYHLTIQGCDLLKRVADEHPQLVASVPESAPGWPLLMACASNDVEPRSMQLGGMIFDQIRAARLYTNREKAWKKLPVSRWKDAEQILRIDSKDCPKVVFALPHLNEKTYKKWWQEAGGPMLEKYWERNPDIAATDWEASAALKRKLKQGRHSVKNYVKSEVRKAFYRIALTYMRTPAIKCDQCGAEKYSKTLRQLRAATRRDGWITKKNNDYCPACVASGLVAA